jgi:hypothetical protein
MRVLTVMLPFALLATCLAAGVSAGEPTSTPRPPLATLDDLAWLCGYWVGEAKGVTMEECWLPPSGGLILGLHRDVMPSGKSFFEYLRIEEGEKGIAYMASPSGIPPTPFWLTSSGSSKAVFENPEHDFPQRITYWLDEEGVLHSRVEGPGEGNTRVEEWFWRRAEWPAARRRPAGAD